MTERAARKVPIRTCVGCEQERPRSEFLRVVRTPEGQVVVDRSGRTPGRGAYLCPSRSCFAQAVKKKRLARTLRAPVPDEVMRQVEEWLDG
ncbi:MAG: YlxR family protein [Armatimonadetes bacterium]|nr:YlxR family protein [Armatimonadota bacterium]